MKKNKSMVFGIGMMALLLLGLVSCGAKEPTEVETKEEGMEATEEMTEETTTSSTREIEDMLGRKLEIPKHITRVATLGSPARLMTYAGCTDRLVGVSEMEMKGNPGMPYTYVNHELFSTLTPVSSGGKGNKNYEEALASLNPEIIFINYTNPKEADLLQEKLNIPVIVLDFQGIFDESVYQALTLIGEVMETQDRSSEVIQAMKAWQTDLDMRTKNIPEEDKPSVYPGAVSFNGGHGIEGTYGKYPPFDAIHGKNVVDETKEEGALMIEKEKLLVWNPDIIFLTPGNMDLVNEDYKKNPDYYDNLGAVKKDQVYTQIAYNYNGTNIEVAIVDAYFAGTVIYPEAFSDLDFEKKAEEIFETMLGQPYLKVLQESGNGFGKITIGK